MINIEGLENLPLSKGRGIKKIGLIHPVSHSEESGIFTGRRENLILKSIYEGRIKKPKKMRSSRGKAPLRMTNNYSITFSLDGRR
jgi:hypothetical protein